MSEVLLAEYGRAKTINFDLYEVDGVDFRTDAADAGADCSIMKDEGAEGTCTNDFVDEGQSYSLVLTAVEMQAARITILVVDSATKVWLDKHIYIETYGHASSQHPNMTPYWTNGAVNDGSATSAAWTFDGFTEATADHVIGGLLTFTKGVNLGQSRPVSDYTSTVITVSPTFLAAPADNDEFVIAPRPAASALDWANGERLDTLLDAIPTTAMRGTDNVVLAGPTKSEMDTGHALLATVADLLDKLGAVDEAAAAGDPSATESVMQYVKQLVNILVGSDGVTTFPAEAAPANGVSLAEVIRAMHADVTGLAGSAMRGTDSVVLAGPTKAEMDTAHGLLATEAKQDTIDGIVDELKAAAIVASGVVESSGSNSANQVQTDLAEASNDHYEMGTILFLDGNEAGQWRTIAAYTGSTGVIAWDNALTGTPADGATFVLLAIGTSAHAVWDMLLTGTKHNISTSAGKRLRQIDAAFEVAGGTAQAGTSNTITLESGSNSNSDIFNGDRIIIIEGTGAGEHDIITAYNGSTLVATVAETWVVTPDSSSVYVVVPASVDIETWQHQIVTASGALPDVNVAAQDDIDFGATQKASIQTEADTSLASYAGPTRTEATSDKDSIETLINALNDAPAVTAASIADAVLNELTAGHTTAGSLSKAIIDILADTNELQGDNVPGLIAALNDAPAVSVSDILTTQMTESYAANGVAPTLAQAQFAKHQMLMQFGIAGVSYTVRKLNNSDTAFVVTLDDGTNPTDAKRV